MADCLSPFASSLAQQHAGATPSEPSRCGSPVRVVGFDSSPTSVVTLRRSQSASESSAAAASDAATAAEGGGGAAAAASVSTPAAADPPMGFGRAPKSLPLDPWAASMARQSSLRTLLMQQEQLTQLHKRLSINTGRSNAGARPSHGPGRGGGRGRSRPDGTRSSASAAAPAAAAGFAQQGCVAAATPCCPEPSGAAAAHAAAAQHTSTFAAAACRAGDGPGELAGTVPSAAMHACARRRRLTLPECGRTAAAPAAVQRPHRSDALGGMLQGEAGVASRRGTAGIDIPERMRRAGSEPHLSDDLIAAAAAAAAAGSSAAAAAALAPAGGPSSSSGGSSQSGSPYVGPSPPKQLPSTVAATGQRAAVTREVLEAQAEAVAASAQARVLQQALEQERQRADRLELQLRALLRERGEERAAAAAAASQQQLAAAWSEAAAQEAAAAAGQRQQQQQRLLAEQHEQLLAAQWAAAAAAQPAPPRLPGQQAPAQLQQAMPAVAVAERSAHVQWGEPPALDELAAALAAVLDT